MSTTAIHAPSCCFRSPPGAAAPRVFFILALCASVSGHASVATLETNKVLVDQFVIMYVPESPQIHAHDLVECNMRAQQLSRFNRAADTTVCLTKRGYELDGDMLKMPVLLKPKQVRPQ